MAKRSGYHHVALRCKDIHATVAFYEALGCSVLRSWGEEPALNCMMDVGGGNIIEIFGAGPDVPEDHPHFEHIALKSVDVQDDYQTALAHGAKSHIEPKQVALGGTMPIEIAFVKGLNDEVIEFFKEL
ncbi:MAG: VOC family protein [Lachnospiraceae bacterium]|nr:VOC family protein [Lachnospiraceae bacterium]